MLGTLPGEKKSDWKSYVAPLVHAYNSTVHDSTGYSPFYLMFGRHPRLPIDVYLGIQPRDEPQRSHHEFASAVRDRLDFAFKKATKSANKSANSNKEAYDAKVRDSVLCPNDRVLVRNVGLKGKNKLADTWEQKVYRIVRKVNPDIPVYVVRPEEGGKDRTLHRNMLLPYQSLPAPRTDTLPPIPVDMVDRPQPQPGQTQTRADVDTDTSSTTTPSSNLRPEAPVFKPQGQPIQPRSENPVSDTVTTSNDTSSTRIEAKDTSATDTDLIHFDSDPAMIVDTKVTTEENSDDITEELHQQDDTIVDDQEDEPVLPSRPKRNVKPPDRLTYSAQVIEPWEKKADFLLKNKDVFQTDKELYAKFATTLCQVVTNSN